MECGHRREIRPIPMHESAKSRCYECAKKGNFAPIPEREPPAVLTPIITTPGTTDTLPKTEPPTPASLLDFLPAISYPVQANLWRAECPFLPTRPVVHAPTREEAEEKLQRQILHSKDLYLTGLHKQHRFFALQPPSRP